jgi:hypothetical protein
VTPSGPSIPGSGQDAGENVDQYFASANVEYYMSVGSLGNRSQPDDFMSAMLYNIFNEPIKSLSVLQIVSLTTFIAFCMFATQQRTQAVIHFLLLDIVVTAIYIEGFLLLKPTASTTTSWKDSFG